MAKIGIAGIGGIGSNIAMQLVRSGIRDIKLVDFDIVDQSNLNRQFYFIDQLGIKKTEALSINLRRINPELQTETEQKILTQDNLYSTFKDCDVIIEGFDKAELKPILIEVFAATDKTIISACGVAGLTTDNVCIKNLNDHVYIVGDFTSDINEKKLYASKVIMISSLMTGIVLKKLGFVDHL